MVSSEFRDALLALGDFDHNPEDDVEGAGGDIDGINAAAGGSVGGSSHASRKQLAHDFEKVRRD